jgi:hypothetical protein
MITTPCQLQDQDRDHALAPIFEDGGDKRFQNALSHACTVLVTAPTNPTRPVPTAVSSGVHN